MSTSTRALTRRQFLTGAAAAIGAAALTACERKPSATPVPTSAPTAVPAATKPPVATVPPTGVPPAPTATRPPAITATPDAGTTADTIFVNGKVVVMDTADTVAQAVAVKNGLITKTGTSDQVRALAGAKTQVIDLKGRTLTPGFIDPHLHYRLVGMLDTYYISFVPPDVKSLPDLQAKLADVAAKIPKTQWIVGYYLALGKELIPDRHELDQGAPAHPVFMMQQAGHFATANSAALKIAGITAATPNPSGGIIERDAKGEPTGRLFNHRAMDVVRKFMPHYSPQLVRDSIISTQPLFAAAGVTSFHDNNVRDPDDWAAYQEVAKQGKLQLRGSIYYALEWPADVDTARTFKASSDANMRFAGAKFLLDGQATTAFCHEPHSGISWNMPTWEAKSFKQAVRSMHDLGMQICVHCVGDATTDLTLDAYEEAMNANPRRDPRHRIEHAVLTTAKATKRIKDLGVIVSTNPTFTRMSGDYWMTLFGEKRTQDRALVTREWLDAGIPVAIGSDAPTTPYYTPSQTLAAAVTRLTISNKVLGKDQILTMKEALRAHTITAAYAGFEEKVKGSLEVGKMADLIVWPKDPYTMTPEQLYNNTLDLTMVGGKILYQVS